MRWSFDEDVVFYRSRGIKRIGVNREKAHDFGIEKCREILLDAGMTVSSYGSLAFTTDLTGPSLKEQIFDAHREVEHAACLGADRLIVHTGGQAGHLRKNRFRIATQVIDQLLPVAEEYGVALTIEPLSVDPLSGKQFSHSLDDSVELIDSYASDSLSLALDLYQAENDFLKLDPDWFTRNVSLIQLSDFVWRCNKKFRTPIGTGELDWDLFCQFVDGTGYQGVFEFELYGEDFDLVSYQETISAIADTLTITPPVSPVELESIRA